LLLDLVNPILVPSVLLFEGTVVVVEAIVIFLMLERNLGKAFAASFTANLVTGALSAIYILFLWGGTHAYPQLVFMFVVGLLVNIFVETGILKLSFFKEIEVRRLLKVSMVMNVVSYGILVLYFVYSLGL
jgi:small-conductance mechanosensitive channel